MDDGLCSFFFFFAAGVRNSIGVDFLLLSFPFRDMEEKGRMVNWSSKRSGMGGRWGFGEEGTV